MARGPHRSRDRRACAGGAGRWPRCRAAAGPEAGSPGNWPAAAPPPAEAEPTSAHFRLQPHRSGGGGAGDGEAAPSFSTEVAANLVALETEITIGSQLMATGLTRVGATTIRQADVHTVLLKLMHRKRESGSVAPLFWEVVTRAEPRTEPRPLL